jgi:hypothetical protein
MFQVRGCQYTSEHMTAHRADRERPAAASEKGDAPSLPVYKAFVVQFTRETRSRAGIFAGRVEHMSSGRRARFASKQELLAALETMLDQLGENAT